LPEHEGTTLEEQERNSDEEDVRLQIEDDDSRSHLLVMSLPYIQDRYISFFVKNTTSLVLSETSYQGF
jgi:hypothetical protein